MTKNVSFDFPLSDTSEWKGQLHVTGKVDGAEVEIESVIHEDTTGRKSNITHLVEEWCSNLYDALCDAARNNAENTQDFSECRTRQYA
jgi:hypothetical protein